MNNSTADANPQHRLQITSPFDGAILNAHHRQRRGDGVVIDVSGVAPVGWEVAVNGQLARRENDKFEGELVVRDGVTSIAATATKGDILLKDLARVVWHRNSYPRYHFAIDDNIYFLRDIAQKRYQSLFDCFYLEMLRNLHRDYQAKFSVNIYFAADDGFTLCDFPDHYKREWQDNAHWLKLAFHALADSPARPYQNAPAERLLSDYDRIAEQIYRFAGAETFATPTNLHWSMATPKGLRALRQRGVSVLSGYFWRNAAGNWDINYGFDARISEYVSTHDLWMNFESDIIFIRDAIVCNETPLEQIVPTLTPLASEPDRREVINLLTHEQYFWPFYHRYLPDHFQRCEAAIRWAAEQGYKPVFLHEGFLGVQ